MDLLSLLFHTLISFIYVGVCLTENLEKRVHAQIMKRYIKSIRPSRHHSEAVNVTFGFALTQIIDVDERNQILTTSAWINQNWLDHSLYWNPQDYENVTRIYLPLDHVWKPDIVLYNNADSQYNTAVMSTDVFISYDGNITWLSAAILKSSCQMNVRYYPFDEQTCVLAFGSWAYDGNYIDIRLVSEQGDLSNYIQSTEFDLLELSSVRKVVEYSCCPGVLYPDVRVTIQIRRKPLFYVFNLMLPCIMLTGIALLGFYMPSESGEKVTLGVTTLLSMTVFMMLVAENMPPTADALPLIGMYYGITICIVSCATALTVFTLNIHHRGTRGQHVPPVVRRLVLHYMAKLLCISWADSPSACIGDSLKSIQAQNRRVCERIIASAELKALYRSSNGVAETVKLSNGLIPVAASPATLQVLQPHASCTKSYVQMLELLKKMHLAIMQFQQKANEKERKEFICIEWRKVAFVMDRLFLFTFTILTGAVTFFILYQPKLMPT